MLTTPSALSFITQGSGRHTYDVQVVESGGQEERGTLAFRDFLREPSDIANEYIALKKMLAALTDAADTSSREAYACQNSLCSNRVYRRFETFCVVKLVVMVTETWDARFTASIALFRNSDLCSVSRSNLIKSVFDIHGTMIRAV